MPGAYAAALALDAAGPDANAVDIAYFSDGFVPSGGTKASTLRVPFEDNVAFRDGGLRAERIARFVKRYDIDGRQRAAMSVPAAEHFGLPQSFPQLRDVTVMLGLSEREARVLPRVARGAAALSRVPPLVRGVTSLIGRFSTGSTGGPDAQRRAKSAARVIATAGTIDGDPAALQPLATITLVGPNPYDITAELLAWAAIAAAGGGLLRAGALGPLAAFGLAALRVGCERAGMSVLADGTSPLDP